VWSWVIASASFGFHRWCFLQTLQIEEGEFGIKQLVGFNVVQIIANLVAWVGIAPTLDILIYQEPGEEGLSAGSGCSWS
jgi:energy-coupling factor transport system substrate-specific component